MDERIRKKTDEVNKLVEEEEENDKISQALKEYQKFKSSESKFNIIIIVAIILGIIIKLLF